MKTYKETLTDVMTDLSSDERVIFVGYNTLCGYGGGTLKNVKDEQLLETPLAENLMASMSIGLSIENYIPILYFERFDFILNAIDSIVNHLDKIKELSQNEFSPSMIIRVVVGNMKNPLYTGNTHTQDFSEVMRKLVSFPVIELKDKKLITPEYKNAIKRSINNNQSTLLVEYKDLYEN